MAADLITEAPASVLGIAAHPDDLDYMAAGTMAAWAAAGADIYFLILTNGDKGTADDGIDPLVLSKLRQQEQRDAAKILGVREVFFCGYEDGLLTASNEVKKDIVRVIRKLRPEVVVTVDPTMLYVAERNFINHSDHRAAGLAAIDAVYPLARDHLSFPEIYKDERLEPHKVKAMYMTHFGKENCYVDITATIALKLQALIVHASQVPDSTATEAMIKKYASEDGVKAGVQYAEGFVRVSVN